MPNTPIIVNGEYADPFPKDLPSPINDDGSVNWGPARRGIGMLAYALALLAAVLAIGGW